MPAWCIRYDGKSLHRLEFPKTKLGDEHFAKFPRSKFPNAIYSPYDVYCILKDSKGNLWFGTQSACAAMTASRLRWLYEEHLTDMTAAVRLAFARFSKTKQGRSGSAIPGIVTVSIRKTRPTGKRAHQVQERKGIERLKDPDGADRVYFMSIVEDANGGLVDGDLWLRRLAV